MNKMHQDELEITETLVHQLIKHQCPQWAQLNLMRMPSSGTDHALFHLGKKYIVRLPRIHWASNGIEKECFWLEKLAPYLTIPISMPIFCGKPDKNYPWLWSVSQFHHGHNPNFENKNEYNLLAVELAHFLNQLHTIPIMKNAPKSRRGVSLIELNEETTRGITALGDAFDTKKLMALWQKICQLPQWHNPPVWVHGDFLPGNIIIKNKKLSAVIDFSDVGIGDPACDLVIAWSLLNKESRNIFRKKLNHIDDITWQRGKGWALSIAAIMFPYYKNTNPTLAKLAFRILNEVVMTQ